MYHPVAQRLVENFLGLSSHLFGCGLVGLGIQNQLGVQHLWFHDGIYTGSSLVYDGTFTLLQNIQHCQGKQATAAIYIHETF